MIHNVIIIGSGPAGLTAALYVARAGLNPLIISNDNGQLVITTEVENFPGILGPIEGPELLDIIGQQVAKYGAKLINSKAKNFNFTSKPMTCQVGQEIFQTKSFILANGASAKWLNLQDERLYYNNGISACATCDGPLFKFRNKHLYVVGGGDTALQEALFLIHFASKVTIIHRRDTLRASKIMQARAFNEVKIDFLWNTVILDYLGDGSQLKGLKLENLVNHEIFEVETNGLFMGIGHQPNTVELKGTGLELDQVGYIQVQNDVETNLAGVFACGDVHDQKYRQAITAAGYGCMAALVCEKYLSGM